MGCDPAQRCEVGRQVGRILASRDAFWARRGRQGPARHPVGFEPRNAAFFPQKQWQSQVRNDDSPAQVLLVGDLEIDVNGHTVKRSGEVLSLTPLEFDLLVCLARKPGQVFTREVLLQEVWGYRHAADTRLVNVHVQRLRAKVERDPERPDIVLTVRGVGYKAGPA